MKNLLRSILIASLSFASITSADANQNTSRPDISGGAALIFKRPENPNVRTREAASKQRLVSDGTSDKVEDAIALGNTARDRTPPDFESAEKAYRLAWKLNPRDPRPYLGLGNLYWDQRRYAEAAKAYRDALQYMERPRGGLWSAMITYGIRSRRMSGDAQTRLYLAATLLQEQKPIAAERELRIAAVGYSDNPELNALFGYALSAQGRYSAAAGAYETAIKLEPLNEQYKALLKEVIQKARKTSSNDQTIATQLQNTTWEIRDSANSMVKGTCKLNEKDFAQCKSGAGAKLPFSSAKWRVRDGLFELEDALFRTQFCIGHVRAETIEVKCYISGSETNDVWTKLRN